MTEQQPLHSSVEDPDQVPELWRDEVQARLDRYKRRRGRRIEGAFTMRFPFPAEESAAGVPDQREVTLDPTPDEELDAEPAISNSSELIAVADAEAPELPIADVGPLESVESAQQEPARSLIDPISAVVPPEPEELAAPTVEMPPRPKPRRKVIAFPASSYVQQEAFRRIADPVQPEQLRILDVPEELQAIPATPFLEGLLDAPAAFIPDTHADMVELPVPTLRTSTRLGAALIDTLTVVAGMAVFLAVASRFLMHDLPPLKFVIAGALGIAVLLWASYQYLFLVYGGHTLGMKLTRVGLRSFKGRSLTFRQRQSRVMALYLSVLSLGMGVLWALVDADGLCWHDRISQTFPAAAGKP
jgi:hypothetical protein